MIPRMGLTDEVIVLHLKKRPCPVRGGHPHASKRTLVYGVDVRPLVVECKVFRVQGPDTFFVFFHKEHVHEWPTPWMIERLLLISEVPLVSMVTGHVLHVTECIVLKSPVRVDGVQVAFAELILCTISPGVEGQRSAHGGILVHNLLQLGVEVIWDSNVKVIVPW